MDVVLDDAGFEAALLTAVLLAVVVVVMARGDRDLRGAPAIAVLATLVGYSVEERLEILLVVGLTVLAAGAWTTRRGRPPRRSGTEPSRGSGTEPFVLKSVAAVPGAILVAVSLPDPVPTWAGVLTFAAIVLVGPAAEGFDERAPRLSAPFLLVTALGIYFCVPETDAVQPLLGAFGVAALLALFSRLATLRGAASTAAGLLVWTAAAGGYPRSGSVVGGVACVGVVVLTPALVSARGTKQWLQAGVLVALVLFCARVAGFEESAWVAAGLITLGFAVAGAVVYSTSR